MRRSKLELLGLHDEPHVGPIEIVFMLCFLASVSVVGWVGIITLLRWFWSLV